MLTEKRVWLYFALIAMIFAVGAMINACGDDDDDDDALDDDDIDDDDDNGDDDDDDSSTTDDDDDDVPSCEVEAVCSQFIDMCLYEAFTLGECVEFYNDPYYCDGDLNAFNACACDCLSEFPVTSVPADQDEYNATCGPYIDCFDQCWVAICM